MIRKILLGAVLLVGLVSAPAMAQYAFTVNPGTVPPGGTATFRGDGCAAGSTVTITFDGTEVATTVANDQGSFNGEFEVPANATPGVHQVTATCGSHVQTASVTVSGTGAGPSTPGTGTLPRTGSNLNTMGLMGAGLLAVGGFFLLANRKRHA